MVYIIQNNISANTILDKNSFENKFISTYFFVNISWLRGCENFANLKRISFVDFDVF